MNPQLMAILQGLGGPQSPSGLMNSARYMMGGPNGPMAGGQQPAPPPPVLPPGMPLPQASQQPGGGMGVPAGHEITIKGPPPPKAPEASQPSKPRTMAPPPPPQPMSPMPTPAQQNPTIQPQNAGPATIPAAPMDPLSMIRRLFGGPTMAPNAPGVVPNG
jgi:hypothetical protein